MWWVVFFVVVVVIFVLYARGGTIVNRLFRGSDVRDSRDTLSWSHERHLEESVADFVSRVAAAFSDLPTSPGPLVARPYLMRSDEAVVIANGTLLMEFWRILLVAVPDEDEAHGIRVHASMGDSTTANGTLPKLEQLLALQRRADDLIGQATR